MATLTVATPLFITAQPANKTGSGGANVTFTVTAKGDGLTYQWQFMKPGGSWAATSATGNKTATLTVPATADRNGYQYRCVVTDKYGNKVTSTAAKLTTTVSLAITTQPTNKTAVAGAEVKFTVKATGTGLTYQWQYRVSSTAAWNNTSATGNKTATLTIATTQAKNGCFLPTIRALQY